MQIPIPMAGEPAYDPANEPHPFLGRGFRPFFLGAAVFGFLSMAIWLCMLSGHWSGPSAHLSSILWHRHAMVFTFTGAVIAGFLLTAVPNWTGGEALRGKGLGLVFLAWLLSALFPFWPGTVPAMLAAFLGTLWLWLTFLWVAQAVFRVGQARNFFAPVMVGGLAFLATLDQLQVAWGFDPVLVALDVILLLMVIIGGRVIPFFSGRAMGGISVKRWLRLDWTLNITLGLGLLLYHANFKIPALILQGFAAFLVLARMWPWHFFKSFQNPMLSVLHLGHLLIAAPLILRVMEAFGFTLLRTYAVHAITTGSLSFLVLGMMTRVSLGHSGRPIQAPKGMALAFYTLIPIFLVRVFLPLLSPAWTVWSWQFSGGLWSVIWLFWAIRFVGILISPRPDGRPA